LPVLGCLHCEVPAAVLFALGLNADNVITLSDDVFHKCVVPGLKRGIQLASVSSNAPVVTPSSSTSALPAKPENVKVTATTQSSATLTWEDKSNNETGFRVQYSKDGGSSWKPWGTILPAGTVTCQVPELAANTPYIFQVGAYNGVDTHWSGYTLTAKTQQVPPTTTLAPSGLSAFANKIVQWDGDKNVQKTSWFVTPDLRRLWVPDVATYYALKDRGATDVGVQPSKILDQLPDQKDRWAAAGDRMTVNRTLRRDMYLRSSDGRYSFWLQGDGNLVLYGPSGKALWANGRFDTDFVIFQGDGNLVGYRADGSPNWASNTNGKGGTYLVVQNDGNVVIYTSAGVPVWATNTAGRD
jgi:hypothetical protein